LVDADVNQSARCIREAVIGVRLLSGLQAFVVITVKVFLSVPKEWQDTVYGAVTFVGARGVVRIVWRIDIGLARSGRQPFRDVPSLSPCLNGRERPPEDEMELAVPAVIPASPMARSASAKSRALSPMSGTAACTMSLSARFHSTR